MKQGDLLQIVKESMSLYEKANPENEEVNAIIKKYLKRKGTPTKEEQAILDKYDITYDKESKSFTGPQGRSIVYSPYNDTTKTLAGVTKVDNNTTKYGTLAKLNDDNFEEIDYANYLTKEKYYEPGAKPLDYMGYDSTPVYRSSSSYNPERYQKTKRSAYHYDKKYIKQLNDEIAYYKNRIQQLEKNPEKNKEDIVWYKNKIDVAEQSINDIMEKARAKHNKLKEEYSLIGQDGNAFSLMGYTARCMKECGISKDEIDRMYAEATSGDYDNLVVVCDKYIQRCNEIAGYDDDDF